MSKYRGFRRVYSNEAYPVTFADQQLTASHARRGHLFPVMHRTISPHNTTALPYTKIYQIFVRP